MSCTANIVLRTDRQRKEGTHSLCLRVIIDRQKREITLPIQVLPSQFLGGEVVDHDSAEAYNLLIGEALSLAHQIFSRFESGRNELTSPTFVACFKRELGKSQTVSLRVQPHIKKVMLKLYGPEPIQIGRKFLPGAALDHLPLDTQVMVPARKSVDLAVQLSSGVHKRYQELDRQISMGVYFEKIFRLMLCTHVQAQRIMGKKVFESISDFYALYGIDETEYDPESAYREYKRWYQPFKENVGAA